jgi:hypothetical protein
MSSWMLRGIPGVRLISPLKNSEAEVIRGSSVG